MNACSDDIDGDVSRAWELVQQANRIEPKSPMTSYMIHWLLAIVHQWRGEDFARSIAEAREALSMTPYDTFLNSDMSWCMANAGHLGEALSHGRWAVEHASNPPGWIVGNLGWVYYLLRRYPEALETTRLAGDGWGTQLAATLVRLGRTNEAGAAWRKANTRDTIVAEARWPLIEPYKEALLQDLRAAGMPET